MLRYLLQSLVPRLVRSDRYFRLCRCFRSDRIRLKLDRLDQLIRLARPEVPVDR